MKFTVQRDLFARLLSRAQGIVEKKSTIAVLSHVLIETVGETEIRLTCTDYDVVLTDRCAARVEREGRLVIAGKMLHDIVKVIPSTDIEVDKDVSNRVHVKAGKFQYHLTGYDPDDFPRIEKPDSEPSISLPISVFRGLLNKVSFCMSQEDARMNLNGVLFDFKDEDGGLTLVCVATDGHRLARTSATFEGAKLPVRPDSDLIVHRKGVSEIRKILDSETGNVSVGFGHGEVVFRAGSASLFVRLIEESYPDYESVIPTGFTQRVLMDTAELVEGMRGVAPLTDPNLLTVRLDIKAERITLSAADAQKGGTGSADVYADFEGEPFTIGFNARYLQEGIAAINGSQLVIKMNDAGAPALMEPADPTESFSYVLMPVEDM